MRLKTRAARRAPTTSQDGLTNHQRLRRHTAMVVEVSNQVTRADAVRVFKALADENRLAILELLKEHCTRDGCDITKGALERSVSEIAKKFDLALSTVSHHIKELRLAGLVTCEKQGQRVHCSVNWQVLEQIQGFLAGHR